VDGPREQTVAVLRRENRCELGDPAQVQAAVREHREQDRMLASGPRDVDPQLGLTLGKVKDVSTVDEHRGGGEPREEPPRVHLGEVLDQRGLDAAGVAEDVLEAGENGIVESDSSAMRRMVVAIMDAIGPRLTKKIGE
jgi:hypothetical protein